jgi:hypothetical protein
MSGGKYANITLMKAIRWFERSEDKMASYKNAKSTKMGKRRYIN